MYLEAAKIWVGLGCSIVGGCCGVFPEHIKSIADFNRVVNYAFDNDAQKKYEQMLKEEIIIEDMNADNAGITKMMNEDAERAQKFIDEIESLATESEKSLELTRENKSNTEMMIEDLKSQKLNT